MRMRKALQVLGVVVLVTLCGSCSGSGLSQAECEEIYEKVHDVMSATYGVGRQHFSVDEEDVGECMAGEWNRKGYDCVMKAETKRDVDTCIFSM